MLLSPWFSGYCLFFLVFLVSLDSLDYLDYLALSSFSKSAANLLLFFHMRKRASKKVVFSRFSRSSRFSSLSRLSRLSSLSSLSWISSISSLSSNQSNNRAYTRWARLSSDAIMEDINYPTCRLWRLDQ